MKPIDHRAIDRATLTAKHRDILSVAGDLAAAVRAPSPDVPHVCRLRWRLAHLLAKHLAREDRCVYPLLAADPDARIAGLAQRSAAELGGLADAYLGYMAAWNAATIAADLPRFAGETLAILAALEKRVRLEELELYPLLTR